MIFGTNFYQEGIPYHCVYVCDNVILNIITNFSLSLLYPFIYKQGHIDFKQYVTMTQVEHKKKIADCLLPRTLH